MAHKLYLSNIREYCKIWIVFVSKWKLDKICFINPVCSTNYFERNLKNKKEELTKRKLLTQNHYEKKVILSETLVQKRNN